MKNCTNVKNVVIKHLISVYVLCVKKQRFSRKSAVISKEDMQQIVDEKLEAIRQMIIEYAVDAYNSGVEEGKKVASKE